MRKPSISLFHACATAAVLAASVSAAAEQTIAIPAYFYPAHPDPVWTQMQDAAPTVGLAVMNPASGPGDPMAPADPNYTSQVGDARAAGIVVLGYVYTSYAARSSAEVEADVDAYYAKYPVDGIFFDEASNDCAMQPYYAALNSYVNAKGGLGMVALNPGTVTPECYASAADVLLNFEGSYSQYQAWSPLGWEAGYDPSLFWHLVYATGESSMPSAVLLSQERGAGWVYVTPDSLPNPWDTLPSGPYWSNELAYVRPSGGSCSTPLLRPRLTVRGVGAPLGNEKLSFSGEVTLPGAPIVDPSANGLGLVLAGAATTALDVVLPAGAYADPPRRGWKTNGSGTVHTYLDRSGAPIGGLTKVTIKDYSSSTPGRVQVKIKSKHGAYDVSAAELPLELDVSFDPGQVDGPCAAATFEGPAPVCTANGSGSVVRCR